jgi:peptidoglycan/xylan/chitin deacetylase (PgdA/CDA1 family)
VLRDLGIPATIFVPTRIVNGDATYFWYERAPEALGWAEITELAGGGVFEFGSHTRTHAWLPRLSDDRAREEIAGSKDDLERRLGRRVTTLAYPAGLYTERELRLVLESGYEGAVTTDPGVNRVGTPPAALRRTLVYANDDAAAFAAKLDGHFDRTSLARRLLLRRIAAGDESTAYAPLPFTRAAGHGRRQVSSVVLVPMRDLPILR